MHGWSFSKTITFSYTIYHSTQNSSRQHFRLGLPTISLASNLLKTAKKKVSVLSLGEFTHQTRQTFESELGSVHRVGKKIGCYRSSAFDMMESRLGRG